MFALIALSYDEEKVVNCLDQLAPKGLALNSREACLRAALAGNVWLDYEWTEKVGRKTRFQESYDRVRLLQLDLLRATDNLTARERAEAGRTLAKLRGGDPRLEVLDVDHIVWCNVPKGDFVMGDEQPQFIYKKLDQDYAISQYPITQSQFKQFVTDKGYARKEFWGTAIAAERWDAVQGVRVNIFKDDKWQDGWTTEPNDFGEPYSLGNHPVMGVSGYEAVAFCEWLSARSGETVRLPSEAEWEKAARGLHGRDYPWQGAADPNKANYDDSKIGSTNAVGCFPNGRAVESGCEEMSGNVWEWTNTKWVRSYKDYDLKENNELDGSGENRVLRGGAVFSDGGHARCACRLHDDPRYRNGFSGIRVVRCAHSSSYR